MFPVNTPESNRIGPYASLHLLYERFLCCGMDIEAMDINSADFSLGEAAEWERYKGSLWGETGEFEKYCALCEAEVLGIPKSFRGNMHRIDKSSASVLSCNGCLLHNKVDKMASAECRFCYNECDLFLFDGCSFSDCFSGTCPFKKSGSAFNYCMFAGRR